MIIYSTEYLRAFALSRTRLSFVTIVTSCGGSPSSSALARCIASSVRTGSTGKGRPTRACAGGTAAAVRRTDPMGLALRFATVPVDQFCGRPRREPDIRPILERVTSLERRTNHTGREELVKAGWTTAFRIERTAPFGRSGSPVRLA